MQQLKSDALLQGGKYKIERVLGQGGFGITYLATQELLNRKVAIKEFFYKEYCERNEETSHVTLGTTSNRELVERFMEKFIKEARTISTLNHPHIIRIYDIFKENNTAYYVMEYIEGTSLAEMVKRQGALPEDVAIDYIKQTASALEFVHRHSINHLDVKPANIMVRKEDNQAVLIDFGLSKQYDASGEQTSTTPVGISHGYAPMEQYNAGGVGTFSPQTDIYSLGATLYKLVTGNTPPQAGEVLNEGLPELPSFVSSSVADVIKKAMQPRKVERYNYIKEFVGALDSKTTFHKDEETVIIQQKKIKITNTNDNKKDKSNYKAVLIYPIVLLIGIITFVLWDTDNNESSFIDSNIATEEMEMKQQKNNDSNTLQQNKQDFTINGHEYVDLGLSVKWATCNVGASFPSDYGDYFAWGETKTKDNYLEKNCSTTEINLSNISSYVHYDAANSLWGNPWRIPTKKEMEELKEKCKWIKDNINGHNGYKIIGPNGNSIFLPASGIRTHSPLYREEAGYYWTSISINNEVYHLTFNYSVDYCIVTSSSFEYFGQSIRPVVE